MIVYGDPRAHVGSGELSREDARRLRNVLTLYLGDDSDLFPDDREDTP